MIFSGRKYHAIVSKFSLLNYTHLTILIAKLRIKYKSLQIF